MDYNHISELLNRYFEGETSLNEERQLRRYFTEGPVAPQHLPYQDLFGFFATKKQTGFEGALEEKLPSKPEPGQKTRRLRILPVFWRAAAIVAIGLSAWWLYPDNPQQEPSAIDWSQYEPQSVEEAFQIMSGALKKTSANLNKGARQAAEEVGKVKRMGKVF